MTAFPTPDAEVIGQDWWTPVVGELPEQRVDQPRTGEKQEIAEYKNGQLILQTQPIRINWLYQVNDDPLQEAAAISTLGIFSDALADFHELMNKWFLLDSSPAVSRLAFGAILLQPIGDIRKGYETLSSYLPFLSLDPINSSDFLYQINRRRETTTQIPNLKINRLTKWSVLRTQLTVSALRTAARVSEAFACRLELDINTAPEFEGEFRKEQLVEIFDELVKLGVEIAEKGDIP